MKKKILVSGGGGGFKEQKRPTPSKWRKANTIYCTRVYSTTYGPSRGPTLMNKETREIIIHIDKGDKSGFTPKQQKNWHATLIARANKAVEEIQNEKECSSLSQQSR